MKADCSAHVADWLPGRVVDGGTMGNSAAGPDGGKQSIVFEATDERRLRQQTCHYCHVLVLETTFSKHLQNRQFFRSMSFSCISSLLPIPRNHDVTSRLRAASLYPRPVTRTKRYTSFINYSLLHYQ